MSLTIGSVVIDNGSLPQWIDEFGDGSDLVGMVSRVSITGASIHQASAQQSGRLMTLQGRREGDRLYGAITRAQAAALHTLSQEPGEEFTVILHDGREFQALFRRDAGPAVEAEPIFDLHPAVDADLCIPTIRLVLV